MSVSLTRHLVEINDYHRMIEAGILTEQDRVELIHGEIIQMSPIGKIHAAIVDRINSVLNSVLGQRAIVRVQSPISIPNHSEPEPDIALLRPRADFYAAGHPEPVDVLLLVEVADTSWEYDYQVKRPLYASAGIPELWLVNLPRHEIEVHRTPATDTYKSVSILGSGDEVPLPGFSLHLSVDNLLGTPVA